MTLPRTMPPIIIAMAAMFVAACEEEKIVYYRPMFAGLPGVESNTPITDSKPLGASNDPPPTPSEELTVKSPDNKTTTLVARNGRHLMIHIYTTLNEENEALFLDQVLSRRTKDEYYERGLDPHEAYVILRDNFDSVKKLFDQMPMGEFTPGMYMEPVGPNVQRVEVHGRAAQGLPWTGFDMIREGTDYRLRWFTGPGPKPQRPDPDDEAPAPVVTGPKRE